MGSRSGGSGSRGLLYIYHRARVVRVRVGRGGTDHVNRPISMLFWCHFRVVSGAPLDHHWRPSETPGVHYRENHTQVVRHAPEGHQIGSQIGSKSGSKKGSNMVIGSMVRYRVRGYLNRVEI